MTVRKVGLARALEQHEGFNTDLRNRGWQIATIPVPDEGPKFGIRIIDHKRNVVAELLDFPADHRTLLVTKHQWIKEFIEGYYKRYQGGYDASRIKQSPRNTK